MPIITEKIKNILKNKNLSRYKLNQIINYNESSLNHMINGKRSFTKEVMEKLPPVLEISREEFESWILADKYSKEILELAVKAKKEKQDDKLILTAKLDEILKSKQLSRTALSKLIKYSQGGLNEMIIGKEPMSKSVVSKISVALDIPEDEIRSWIVADKYSIESLEFALKICRNLAG